VDLENIIQQILRARRDLSRDDVLKMIYEKKRSAEDYFLDEVAARIIASELGVEIQGEEKTFQGEIAIKDLVSGLNDVTVSGRVVAVYPAQTFSRNDMTEGKVARLLLADRTGTLKLVVWDDKVDLVKTGKIQPMQIVRVLHGYARDGIDGKLELHVGKRGELLISPPDIDENTLPDVADLMDKIGQLTPEKRRASVMGSTSEVFQSTEFTRQDGTKGKVRRLRLRDETGEIIVVFWNEKVDELGAINEGAQMRITNARIKAQVDGRIELHVENSSQIEKTAGAAQHAVASSVLRKIAELKEEGGPFTVEATVATVPNFREVTTTQSEKVSVASFDLEDDTGKIGVSLWRKHAEVVRHLQMGTRIRIENAYVKRGFSNLPELVSRASTTIETVPKQNAQASENRVE